MNTFFTMKLYTEIRHSTVHKLASAGVGGKRVESSTQACAKNVQSGNKGERIQEEFGEGLGLSRKLS